MMNSGLCSIFFGGRSRSFLLRVDARPLLAGAVLPLLDAVVDGLDVLAAALPGELLALVALHLVAHLVVFFFRRSLNPCWQV